MPNLANLNSRRSIEIGVAAAALIAVVAIIFAVRGGDPDAGASEPVAIAEEATPIPTVPAAVEAEAAPSPTPTDRVAPEEADQLPTPTPEPEPTAAPTIEPFEIPNPEATATAVPATPTPSAPPEVIVVEPTPVPTPPPTPEPAPTSESAVRISSAGISVSQCCSVAPATSQIEAQPDGDVVFDDGVLFGRWTMTIPDDAAVNSWSIGVLLFDTSLEFTDLEAHAAVRCLSGPCLSERAEPYALIVEDGTAQAAVTDLDASELPPGEYEIFLLTEPGHVVEI